MTQNGFWVMKSTFNLVWQTQLKSEGPKYTTLKALFSSQSKFLIINGKLYKLFAAGLKFNLVKLSHSIEMEKTNGESFKISQFSASHNTPSSS